VVAPGPVVVYGTGYDYPAWVGAYWYPGPGTWGWGPFDLGFGVGFLTDFEFGFGFRHHFHHFRQANFHHFRHHELGHLNVYRHWRAARPLRRPARRPLRGPPRADRTVRHRRVRGARRTCVSERRRSVAPAQSRRRLGRVQGAGRGARAVASGS